MRCNKAEKEDTAIKCHCCGEQSIHGVVEPLVLTRLLGANFLRESLVGLLTSMASLF